MQYHQTKHLKIIFGIYIVISREDEMLDEMFYDE